MDFQYLAIEGPIGTGKTTLARHLALRLDATTVLDNTDNPFVADLYAGRAGAAFQAQLFSLLARHRQQSTLRQTDLFNQLVIADYLFDKDKIYAYLNLDDNELFIYQRLYDLLAPDLVTPDLVVYLQAPSDLVRQRVRQRLQQDADAVPLPNDEYLGELIEALQSFLLPLQCDAAPGGRDVGIHARLERSRPGRSDPTASRHGPRNALLRAAYGPQRVLTRLPRNI